MLFGLAKWWPPVFLRAWCDTALVLSLEAQICKQHRTTAALCGIRGEVMILALALSETLLSVQMRVLRVLSSPTGVAHDMLCACWWKPASWDCWAPGSVLIGLILTNQLEAALLSVFLQTECCGSSSSSAFSPTQKAVYFLHSVKCLHLWDEVDLCHAGVIISTS